MKLGRVRACGGGEDRVLTHSAAAVHLFLYDEKKEIPQNQDHLVSLALFFSISMASSLVAARFCCCVCVCCIARPTMMLMLSWVRIMRLGGSSMREA